MIELVTKGGPLIWLLLACSLIALGIFAERFFHLHRSVIDVGELLHGLANLIKKKNYAEALHEVAGTPGPVARVVKAALVRHDLARSDLKQVVQEAGQLEVPKLERYLPVLLSICYVTPLIGLLGTVIGLTDTFIKLENGNGFATPAELSGGVYKSLLTSAAGLAVAIPAYLLYAYLAAFVKSLMHDMERGGIEIVNVLIDSRPVAVEAANEGQIIAFNRGEKIGR
jgi:biopolymer transport protein ExbB